MRSGIRHFSARLCTKVKQKGNALFNEVADEIVHDFIKSRESREDGKPHSEKNIKRRVYDALNVLMAMDVMTKKKKKVEWKGLPRNAAKMNLELLKVNASCFVNLYDSLRLCSCRSVE